MGGAELGSSPLAGDRDREYLIYSKKISISSPHPDAPQKYFQHHSLIDCRARGCAENVTRHGRTFGNPDGGVKAAYIF